MQETGMQETAAHEGIPVPARRHRLRLKDCNVVVTTQPGRRQQARRHLLSLGEVRGSGYRGVLLMKVGDRQAFLEALREHLEHDAALSTSLSRAVPADVHFTFETPEQLEDELRQVLTTWAPRIEGQCFHVRFRRRGFKEHLSSREEELRLAGFLFEALAARGQSARVDFKDPDWIVYVDTVGPWAGASMWSRDARQRYPFLRVE